MPGKHNLLDFIVYKEIGMKKDKAFEYPILHQDRVWTIAILVALAGGFFFLRPYLGVIVLAMLMAFLFYPVYTWLLKKFKGKKTTAITVATIFHVLAIAIPILLILYFAVAQGLEFVDKLGVTEVDLSDGGSIEKTVYSGVAEVNKSVESVTGIKEIIPETDVANFLSNTLPNFINAAIESVIKLIAGIPTFFMLFIIYLFVFTSITLGRSTFIKKVRALSPFDKDVTAMYITKIKAMAIGMVKGQFIIAFLQALLGSLSLIPLIGADYFAFFLILFTFLNLIPLGSGLILIPTGIVALLFGNYIDGAIILGTHFALTTNIDNVLRPLLVPKAAYMPAAFTMISAFAGVYFFGFLGVIYGPIIMIVILTTVDAYIAQKESYQKKLAAAVKNS